MAATYIQPTLADFEEVFGSIEHKQTKGRAFELVRPGDSEAFYLCTIKKNDRGELALKVFTSIAPAASKARECGEDAIRCALVWIDREGWVKALGKGSRVNRSGGRGSTARDVVERALVRAREVARCRGKLPSCPDCGRPMVVRVTRKTNKPFYGCIAWKPNGGCSGTSWEVDPSDPNVAALVKAKDRCCVPACKSAGDGGTVSNQGKYNGRYCQNHFEGLMESMEAERNERDYR